MKGESLRDVLGLNTSGKLMQMQLKEGPGSRSSRQNNMVPLTIWSEFSVKKDTGKGLWTPPPWLKKSSVSRHETEKSLYEDPERPLHEALNSKSGLHWRPQDVGDARAMGHLPRRATKRNSTSTNH